MEKRMQWTLKRRNIQAEWNRESLTPYNRSLVR